jgi:hypothetical protein
MSSPTIDCFVCGRQVAWTETSWDAERGCCRECAKAGRSRSDDALTAEEIVARKVNQATSSRVEAAEVRVTGIDIPFSDLVAFMVKLAFASIPAGMIVGFVLGLIYIFLQALGRF